ncbi:MAG: transposase [Planctomycetes bacterium]|nr:transposase [Planctomycetota bacterium]
MGATTTSLKPGSRRRRQPAAPLLPFRPQHGGRRAGAGRKPNGAEAGVDHRTRAALAPRFPVHVTVKLRAGLPRLRRRDEYAALRAAFVAGCRGSAAAAGAFRLCHYAVLNDHLHLIVEAKDRLTLSRGLQGLLIRIARKLNKLWSRKGKVFADRYHDHILKSPRETRNALRYVLQNARHHAAKGRMVDASAPIDTFTSAPWFDGFRQTIRIRGLEAIVRPITAARTWLLTIGWRRHGLLDSTPATG